MSHLEEGVLTALLDGEIPSVKLPPIQAHLKECAACRALLQELRDLAGEAEAMITSLGDGSAPAPAAAVAPLRGRSRTRTYRLVAWAATVAMAAGLGWWARGPAALPTAGLAEDAVAAPTTGAVADAANDVALATGTTEPDPAATATAQRSAESPTERRAVPAAPIPPPARDQPDALGRASVRSDAEAAKLAERVVPDPGAAARGADLRSAAAPAAAPRPPEAAVLRQEVSLESFAPISFPDAVARMGGSLRLIEGLVPDRLEASDSRVRVIYPLQAGELILEQRRAGDSIEVALRGPISADSLAALRRRVR